MKKLSQVSLEYLLVIGMVLVIMIPIFYYAITQSTNQIRANQAEDAVTSIVKTADSLYALGPGSRDYVTITIPLGVSGAFVNRTEVTLRLDISGTQVDITAFSHAEIVGKIPTTAGTYQLPIEVVQSGIVIIGSTNDTDAPVVVYASPSGRITYDDINLKANTNEPSLCRFDNLDNDYNNMANNFDGSLMSHDKYLGILPEDEYVFYVRCIDLVGNVMQSSAIISFEINTSALMNWTNETYEANAPVVSLVFPQNNYTDDDGLVFFQYDVVDESSIGFCELLFNNTVKATQTGVSRVETNNLTRVGLDFGSYLWSINCTDVHGNEGASGKRSILINFTQDYDTPNVYLMGPPDGLVRNYWLIKFLYNVTDTTSAIDHCTVYLNGTTDQGGNLVWESTDEFVIEDSEEEIILALSKANYTWNIACTDNSQNSNVGYSETRWLRVNISEGGGAYVSSCAGWCGLEGLSDGTCENNIAKCGIDCGLPYNSKNTCYAGDEVSAQYCIGGAESDTCCCIV
ncbi:hypothetical protein ACFL6I_07915 [candidate division KSB1 bacterium]